MISPDPFWLLPIWQHFQLQAVQPLQPLRLLVFPSQSGVLPRLWHPPAAVANLVSLVVAVAAGELTAVAVPEAQPLGRCDV